jgi:hypothetical protein
LKYFILLITLATSHAHIYSQVAQAWVQRYNPATSDYPAQMITDGSGNIYITGSQGSGNRDILTRKYNSAGTLQWSDNYNAPDNREDYAKGIAKDNAGNIYVTGSSSISGINGYRAITIKYNAAGVRQWIALFNPAGYLGSEGFAVTTDAAGNVYVAGHSDRSGYEDDYCTLKYNAAGVLQWSQLYNGTNDGMDQAKFIKVDNAGNVVVTGESMGSMTRKKLNRDGTFTIITVATLLDIATVKYNSNGVQQWAIRYNGAGNDNDQPQGMITDSIGNIFITGSATISGGAMSMVTLKYDNAGNNSWTILRPGINFSYGNAIARDVSGNIIVAGGTSAGLGAGDLLIVKYNGSGNEVWSNTYNGGLDDNGQYLVLDGEGNAYITGTSIRQSAPNSQTSDIVTLKFNSSGSLLWTIKYNGPANSSDMPVSIALYSSPIVFTPASVYVAGYDTGIGTGLDWVLIKYTQPSTVCCVASKSVIDERAAQFSIHNSPNPFTGATNFQYELPQPGKVLITVYDLNGRLLASINEGNRDAGVYRKTFYGDMFSKGVYQYKITLMTASGELSQTRRMVVK